jgi:Spy/CpxP family protein refolding chaperone
MAISKITKAVLLAALSAFIVAGCYHPTPEQRAEHIVNKIAKELKLNDAQKAKLEKIKDEFLARRPEMIKAREETLRTANELMRSDVIDKAKLDALVEKNKADADGMITFIAAKFTEIHDMLTPEQRRKLVDHMEKYMWHGNEKKAEKTAPAGGGY